MAATAGRADQGRLYEQHALALQAVVSRRVHTSPVNVEDACGFAWLQLVRCGNRPASTFAWLCTIAIREALKLHRRAARTTGLDEVADAATDPRYDVNWRVELIVAGEEIREARLHPRGPGSSAYGRRLQPRGNGRAERRHLPNRRSPASASQRKLRHARRTEPKVGSRP